MAPGKSVARWGPLSPTTTTPEAPLGNSDAALAALGNILALLALTLLIVLLCSCGVWLWGYRTGRKWATTAEKRAQASSVQAALCLHLDKDHLPSPVREGFGFTPPRRRK